MRILWLTTNLLLPLDKGGKLRTWHLMRHLAARHEITCICFADPDQPSANYTGMSAVSSELVTVPRRERSKEGLGFGAAVARNLFQRLPYAVAQYQVVCISPRGANRPGGQVLRSRGVRFSRARGESARAPALSGGALHA